MNNALPAGPSARPEIPATPATVVTPPAGVTRRIAALPVSATTTFPEPSTATPAGWLNSAFMPVPSLLPLIPAEPARVVTAPAGVILRMVSL